MFSILSFWKAACAEKGRTGISGIDTRPEAPGGFAPVLVVVVEVVVVVLVLTVLVEATAAVPAGSLRQSLKFLNRVYWVEVGDQVLSLPPYHVANVIPSMKTSE